jgi:TetR/AcrR family transcriptional regulator, tetracycline repressor protein
VRRQPLTREIVLDAAIALLDREGLAALSMRRLGAALGVEAMSLYHHVPNKRALLDGIHERILASLAPPAHARSWQAYVRHQAHALHRALRAHPHAIPLFATRPAATATSIEQLGRYVETLHRAGFASRVALSIVQLVAQLVVGHAMWTTALDGSAGEPAVLERAAQAWDADGELELGIDALIHGFARLRA